MLNEKYRCSFCGKKRDDAKMIFAGKQFDLATVACICDECIVLCYEVIHTQEDTDEKIIQIST